MAGNKRVLASYILIYAYRIIPLRMQMEFPLKDLEIDCKSYFSNVTNDYLEAKTIIKEDLVKAGFLVAYEIGHVDPLYPTSKKVFVITNILARKVSEVPEVPIIGDVGVTVTFSAVLDTQAILIHFPSKTFSTKMLLKKVERVKKVWSNIAIYLVYRKAGKRTGKFPLILERITRQESNLFIYSIDLNAKIKKIRCLYNPMDLKHQKERWKE